MMNLTGKTAVVTGAATGIGKGLVNSFVNQGMKVVLADINEVPLEQTVLEFKDRGADVIGVPTDVSRMEDLIQLAQRAYSKYGKICVLCNNAGIGYGVGPSWTHSPEDWNWMLSVNLMGVVNGVSTFLPKMIEQGEPGYIINTSSIAGLNIGAGNAMYSVSKHGIVAYSECLYNDLAMIKSPISVSVLCPGFVNTEIMDPMKSRPEEMGRVEEVSMTASEEGFQSVLKEAIERGMDPNLVGEKVIEAMRKNQFYIVTHQNSKESIKRRFNTIMNDESPLSVLPRELVEIMQKRNGI